MKIEFEKDLVYPCGLFPRDYRVLELSHAYELLNRLDEEGFEFDKKGCSKIVNYSSNAGCGNIHVPLDSEISGVNYSDIEYLLKNDEFEVKIGNLDKRSFSSNGNPKGNLGVNVNLAYNGLEKDSNTERTKELFGIVNGFYEGVLRDVIAPITAKMAEELRRKAR